MDASLQNRILSKIQTAFPLDAQPYDALATELHATPRAAQEAVLALREAGVIRRIGATFDPSHLGYVSTLAAIAIENPERIDAVAAAISSYQEVTHNYLRDDRYNIWFTVIAPTRARIEAVLGEIAQSTGCDNLLDLPATRLFKIRVNFDVAGTGDEGFRQRTVEPNQVRPLSFSEQDRALVRALQGDLGTDARPFDQMAAALNLDTKQLLRQIDIWKESGAIRRFGAVLRHRKLGSAGANAMTVWNVPDEQAQAAGELMSAFTEVSHCYERLRRPQWNDNLYTMIHAATEDACYRVASDVHAALTARGIAIAPPRLLFSSKEFKKRSMRYFMEDAAADKSTAAGDAKRVGKE